jgi:HEPN domain-containing protein
MNDKIVTETPLELFTMANGDIEGVEGHLNNKYGFKKRNRILATSYSQLAVEKLLKGYLRYMKETVQWGHNLKEYYLQSYNLDKSFINIENNIHNLNKYNSGLKYTLKIDISDNEFTKILQDVKIIYNFQPIQKIYDEFTKNTLCDKISVERFDNMIKIFDDIVNKDIKGDSQA